MVCSWTGGSMPRSKNWEELWVCHIKTAPGLAFRKLSSHLHVYRGNFSQKHFYTPPPSTTTTIEIGLKLSGNVTIPGRMIMHTWINDIYLKASLDWDERIVWEEAPHSLSDGSWIVGTCSGEVRKWKQPDTELWCEWDEVLVRWLRSGLTCCHHPHHNQCSNLETDG